MERKAAERPPKGSPGDDLPPTQEYSAPAAAQQAQGPEKKRDRVSVSESGSKSPDSSYTSGNGSDSDTRVSPHRQDDDKKGMGIQA